MLTDRGLVYRGRIDQQVQLRGYRIELGDVVAGLESTGLVSSAVVRLVESDDVESYLAAWVVTAPEVTIAEIRCKADSILPQYMIPARIITVDNIPTTSNGKPDFDALSLPDFTTSANEESNDLASEIAKVWETVIGTGHIAPHDRFMEVGGTSMHIMEIHDMLSRQFNADWLTLIDLFSHPTPADLADLIHSHQSDTTFSDQEKIL
jgi:hypothetical protein